MPIKNIEDILKTLTPLPSEMEQKQQTSLVYRLKTIEQLCCHEAPMFFEENIVKPLYSLIQKKLPCQYIIRILEEKEPLYTKAQPQEHKLLQEIAQHFTVLEEYLLSPQTILQRRNWLDWFISIKSPARAASFIQCLQQHGVNLQQLELYSNWYFCFTRNDDSNDFAQIHIPENTWPSWAINLHLLQQLPEDIARVSFNMLENILRFSPKISSEPDISSAPEILTLPLTLLIKHGQKTPYTQQQITLISIWLRYSLSKNSTELLLPLLNLIQETENPNLTDIFSLIVTKAIEQNTNKSALESAIACVRTINKLDQPLASLFSNYIKDQNIYFNSVAITKLSYVIEKIPAILALLPTNHSKLLTNIMQSSDIAATFDLLNNLLILLKDKTEIYNKFILSISNYQPLDVSLQELEKLFTAFYLLDEKAQKAAMPLLKTAINETPDKITKEANFFKAMTTFDVDVKTWEKTHELWLNGAQSAFELKEKLEFIKIITTYTYLSESLLNRMLRASAGQRNIMLALQHDLPKNAANDYINNIWQQILNNQDVLAIRSTIQAQYLANTIATMDTANLNTLFNFKDETKTKDRAAFFQAIYHDKVLVDKSKRQNLWSQYLKAMSDFISPPKTDKSIELDKQHHLFAIQKLERTAQVIFEIKAIAAQPKPNDKPILISQSLKDYIKNYETAYNNSWWKSGDRRKLAKTFFAKTANPNMTYEKIITEINGVIKNIEIEDKKHSNRNQKGYSRLHDIAIQLLTMTISEAIKNDPTCNLFVDRIKVLHSMS